MNPVGDRSITDIALAWGFGSLPTFNRTFRRAFGATPGEFRGQALSPGWPSMSEAAAAPR
jgi:AraC-like DNA-binding protein